MCQSLTIGFQTDSACVCMGCGGGRGGGGGRGQEERESSFRSGILRMVASELMSALSPSYSDCK